MNYYEEALKLHEKHQGKIHTELNCEINTMDDMSVVYTPGVAEPCRKIAENEDEYPRIRRLARSKLEEIDNIVII